MATDYGKRLREARKHAKLTQEGLSKKTGTPQSTISTAERSGNGSADTSTYAKACGVDVHWLATGEGEMLPVAGGYDVSEMAAAYTAITPTHAIQVLSQALLVMAPASRERAATLLSSMASDPEGQWAAWLSDLVAKEVLQQDSKTDDFNGQGINPSNLSNSPAKQDTIKEKSAPVLGSALKRAFEAGKDIDEFEPGGISKSRGGRDS